jgi:hypothetical protein
MLVYLMDIWSILRSFGIFYGYIVYFVVHNLVYFSRFGILYQRKIWQPWRRRYHYINHAARATNKWVHTYVHACRYSQPGVSPMTEEFLDTTPALYVEG